MPILDSATRTRTRNYLSELDKSQWFNSEKIEEIQEKRLARLVQHAYRTVPYYRRIFRANSLKPDDIRSYNDLTKLPILSRNEVREQFHDLVSRGYPREKMIYSRSGGSTGEPIRFYTTRENREHSTAARYLAWRWAGFEIGEKFAHIVGSPLDRPFFKSVRGEIEGKIKRRIYLNAFGMSQRTLESFVDKMKLFKPRFIYGYAKSVALIAKFIEDKEIEGINLKSVIVDSESLFDHEERTIEKVFGCKISWNYHNRENGTFGAECSHHDAYHLFSQNQIFEFVKEGEHVAPGQVGSVIVTDLTNYAMPFIRYEIGDLGIPLDQTCSCGRGLPLMRKLIGRTSEVLVSASGKFMWGDLFHLYNRFYDIIKIKQYQIIQETPTRLTVNVVPEEDFKEEDSDAVKKTLRSIIGDMEIEVKLVSKIAPSSSGKVQTVLRKFPIKFT